MFTSLRWILPLAVLMAIASYVNEGDEAVSAPPRTETATSSQNGSQPIPKPGESSNWSTPRPGYERGEVNPPNEPRPASYTKVTSFDAALASTTEFWQQHINNYIQPNFKIYSGNVRTWCIAGDTARNYAFYCPVDQTVYMNQSFISEMPSPEGLYQVVAHEVAHHVQHVTGTHAGHRTEDHTRHSEDEADCFSGAWVGWVIENGNEPNSSWITDINTKWQHYQWVYEYSAQLGSLSRTHSEPTIRQQTFMKGVESGLAACGSPLF